MQGKWDTAFEVACKKINPGLSKEDRDVEVTKAKKNVIKTYNRKMIRVSLYSLSCIFGYLFF